jgi:hypothetical protein
MEKFKNDANFKDLYISLNEINELFKKIEANKIDFKTAEQLKDKIMEFRSSLI